MHTKYSGGVPYSTADLPPQVRFYESKASSAAAAAESAAAAVSRSFKLLDGIFEPT